MSLFADKPQRSCKSLASQFIALNIDTIKNNRNLLTSVYFPYYGGVHMGSMRVVGKLTIVKTAVNVELSGNSLKICQYSFYFFHIFVSRHVHA